MKVTDLLLTGIATSFLSVNVLGQEKPNAHCQAPISGPLRASIMTGMYPSTTGNYLQVNDVNIKKSGKQVGGSVFMADYFEEYGNKTMAVGKIFHNGDGAKSFDEYGGRFDWFGPKPAERINYDPATQPGESGRVYKIRYIQNSY